MAKGQPYAILRHAGCLGVLGPNRDGIRTCQTCGALIHIGLAEPSIPRSMVWPTVPGLSPQRIAALWRQAQAWVGSTDEED